jgi:hypothetical protein
MLERFMGDHLPASRWVLFEGTSGLAQQLTPRLAARPVGAGPDEETLPRAPLKVR